MLNRLDAGPLVRMVCMEVWARTPALAKDSTAITKTVPTKRPGLGPQKCKLFKTQTVEAVGADERKRDRGHPGSIHLVARDGAPLNGRRKAAGLLESKGDASVGPGKGNLVVDRARNGDRRHGGYGEARGEFRGVAGWVGGSGRDHVADRDLQREIGHEISAAVGRSDD